MAISSTASPQSKRPVAFLDRDGVLNIDHGYVHTPETFDWTSGAREAVKILNDSGYLVVLVTNQSGIGRGYYDEATFALLVDWMQAQLAEVGAHMDDVYFCPHHPKSAKGDYLKACRCRKPNPGMVEQACEAWDVDMGRSFVIGDSQKDMELAENVGIPGYRYTEGNLLEFVRAILESE